MSAKGKFHPASSTKMTSSMGFLEKPSKHGHWAKGRLITLLGMVRYPCSRVLPVSTKCSPKPLLDSYCSGNVQKIHPAIVLACLSVHCEQPVIYSDFQNYLVLQ